MKESKIKKTSHPRKTDITVALSTLGEKIDSIEQLITDISQQTHSNFELLIVAQTDDENKKSHLKDLLNNCALRNHQLIISSSKGLLTSRNIALRNAKGELIVLADDDCRFYPKSLETIVSTAALFAHSDILTFQAQNKDLNLKNSKNAFSSGFIHNYRSIMSICSIETIIRKSSFANELNTGLFDERYGLGTPFSTGGENIMLADALRNKKTITAHPYPIVQHPDPRASIDKFKLEEIAFSKGAMFRRMFGLSGIIPLFIYTTRGLFSRRRIRFNFRSYKYAIRGFCSAPT